MEQRPLDEEALLQRITVNPAIFRGKAHHPRQETSSIARVNMSRTIQPQTPMLQQYFRAKAEYPEALLMMRVGDFYELYGEDAEIAARELEIVLTGRDDGKNGRVPMAGVPYHAVERYVARWCRRDTKSR
jgi:hypothetical protein